MSDTEQYGTLKFYEEAFADILADIATGSQAEDDETAKNILLAFKNAIEGWIDYHQQSADTYKQLLADYLAE
jgi:hypothetical protein